MEGLSQILQPYKELIGNAASVITIGQFFSGVFICLDIRKQKSTKGISCVPFVGGIMMGLVFLKYGLMLKDPVMLNVNVAAIALNVIYTVFFYQYCSDKFNEFFKPFSFNVAIVAAMYGYCEWEHPELLEYRYGLISTVLMLALLASPLFGVKEIIEKKDASSIPFVLTFMGTIATFTWLLYSIVLLNNFMLVQNVLGFILCASQLVLIFVFPGPGKAAKQKKLKSHKE